MSITTPGTQTVSAAEAARRIEFADAALGAAGHEVTDPELQRLRWAAARGEMSVEDALAAGMAHLDAR
ncbi:hypothetical protein [Curtobacterium sp. L1-20]|uniref:hypothetical protein n=1 Tax=Curtobacterium sp. L1-20 TaxID=3138181 RepID=UPI003B525ACA